MHAEQYFGAFFVVLGVLSLGLHVALLTGVSVPAWLRFRKLEAMRARWGNVAGTALHVLGYVVGPIVFGLALLLGLSP